MFRVPTVILRQKQSGFRSALDSSASAMLWKWLVPSIALVMAFFVVHQVESCNEAVCGSVVSKCLLTKSCNCDLKNCTCCKDCYTCLSYLFSECCSCVDMCPKPNDTGSLRKNSHVEDFSESVPALFDVLTEVPDQQARWTSYTFAVDFDMNHYAPPKKNDDVQMIMKSAEQDVSPVKTNIFTFNCTVAFWSQCMSWTKCRNSCQTMGASSFRWFHDGCCECVGKHCINYGINQSNCTECSLNQKGADNFEFELNEEDYDYGDENNMDYPPEED